MPRPSVCLAVVIALVSIPSSAVAEIAGRPLGEVSSLRSSLSAQVAATPSESGRKAPLRRVVWDEYVSGRGGIHLRSANPDGSELTSIYNAPKGFTLELTLDRKGRRVAFSPCCRDSFPRLVVAPVLGGKALKPLARHRQFHAVGGLGWSPNGKRIVFEGYSKPGDQVVRTLNTVRVDGTGLRLVKELSFPQYGAGTTNQALAWTPQGILYVDGRHLWVTRSGDSRLVLRNVRSVRVSGDGRHILTDRYIKGRQTLWISSPDGSMPRRIATFKPPTNADFYSHFVPNFNGTHVLAYRLPKDSSDPAGLVTWQVGESPAEGEVLAWAAASSGTWN